MRKPDFDDAFFDSECFQNRKDAFEVVSVGSVKQLCPQGTFGSRFLESSGAF